MVLLEINKMANTLKPGERILGLDLGGKTIGLAISNSTFTVASPLQTIRRTKFTADANALKTIIDNRGVGGLIFGLPKNMDGSEGPRAQSTRQFAKNILNNFDIPIAFWDERLSTIAVERFLIREFDLSRKKRGKIVDKMAANYILQGALALIVAQNFDSAKAENHFDTNI